MQLFPSLLSWAGLSYDTHKLKTFIESDAFGLPQVVGLLISV